MRVCRRAVVRAQQQQKQCCEREYNAEVSFFPTKLESKLQCCFCECTRNKKKTESEVIAWCGKYESESSFLGTARKEDLFVCLVLPERECVVCAQQEQ